LEDPISDPEYKERPHDPEVIVSRDRLVRRSLRVDMVRVDGNLVDGE